MVWDSPEGSGRVLEGLVGSGGLIWAGRVLEVLMMTQLNLNTILRIFYNNSSNKSESRRLFSLSLFSFNTEAPNKRLSFYLGRLKKGIGLRIFVWSDWFS